jgi:hypothetical protein
MKKISIHFVNNYKMNIPLFFTGLFLFLAHYLFDQQMFSVIGLIMIVYGYTEWSLYNWLYVFIWIIAGIDILIFVLKLFKIKIPSRAKCAQNRKKRREELQNRNNAQSEAQETPETTEKVKKPAKK